MDCLDLIFEMLPGSNSPLDHASKVRSGLRLTTLGQIFRWKRPQNPKVAFTNKFSRKSCNYEFLNARRISRRLPKLTQALFALSGILPEFSRLTDTSLSDIFYEQKIKLNSTEPKRQRMVENGSGDCQSE